MAPGEKRLGPWVTKYVGAIRDVYPSLDIQSVDVEPLGQRNHVVVVNDSIIFKFPRTRNGLHDLRKERLTFQHLSGRLPVPIPEPLYEHLEPVDAGMAFVGYARLPGKPLRREALFAQTEGTRQSVAVQLAQFLRVLHATASGAIGIDLPTADTHEYWADFHARVVEKLFPFMRPESRTAVSEHFESYVEERRNFAHVPVLRHGDFGPSNILFDDSTSSLSGVIDFGSAALGDPAVDLAGMMGPFGYGEEFARLVVHTYTELQPLLVRARFYAGTFALQEALLGLEHKDERAFERGIAGYR